MTPWPFLLAAAGMGCCALAQHWWHRRVLQSEHRYHQLIERAPIGIAVVADDGHIQLANPALWQMMGSPPAQQIDILTFPHWSRPGSPPTCTAAWKPLPHSAPSTRIPAHQANASTFVVT